MASNGPTSMHGVYNSAPSRCNGRGHRRESLIGEDRILLVAHRTALPFTLAFGLSLALISAAAAAQPLHRLHVDSGRFVLEEIQNGHKRPFDMWVARMSNALFDRRFTDQIINNLDDYTRYGVNTLVVGVQGGNLQTSKNYLYPKVYNADGTLGLSSVVWSNLDRLLDETDRRGIILMLQGWYFLRHGEVPDDDNALLATRRAIQWIRNTGHRNVVFDLVNEFGHNAYTFPGRPTVKRPLFTTLEGALRILNTAYGVWPDAIAGVSPTGGLAAPEGLLATAHGLVWVESGMIIGHNQVSDPNNPASYKIGGRPHAVAGKPYVNNEFDLQLGGERYPQRDPVTGEYTYGHFTAASVSRYLTDMRALRQIGAHTNVFSSYQQFVPPKGTTPDAFVGPEGTQPEATAGAGEGSVHWIYAAVAGHRKLAALETRHDFENGLHPGIELDRAGTWAINNGRLEQTDALANPAWARLVPDTGDVVIEFEASFLADPGATGALAIHLGAAGPAGPAYRLRVTRDQVVLDQVAGSLKAQSAVVKKLATDRYALRIERGRIVVRLNGRTLMDVADTQPMAGRNLLLVTRGATAAFDNIRTGPVRTVPFDDGKTGAWVAADSRAWSLAVRSGQPTNKVWEVVVPVSSARHAYLDRRSDDFAFAFELDLGTAARAGLRFRLADVNDAGSAGYALWIEPSGRLALERLPVAGAPVILATAQAKITPASVRVLVTTEGARIRVSVDGARALDATDPAPLPEPGALALVAESGTTRFDNLRFEGGPSRHPTPTFAAATGTPIPAGFAIEAIDPDGVLDLARMTLELDLGAGFFDVSVLLTPAAGLFAAALTPDGLGLRYTLLKAVPAATVKLRLRVRVFDHAGRLGEAVIGFNQG